MSDMGMGDLADEISKKSKGGATIRLGKIEAVDAGTQTVSVRIAESTTVHHGATYVKYAPKINETVLCFQDEADIIVWGIPGSTSSVPPGVIEMFAGSTPPAGYLLCNGQSTSGYPALADVVGGNVPDLRNRFIVGAGSAYTVGNTGGVDSNTSVASHSHTQPSHTHAGFNHNHATPNHTHIISATRYNTDNNHVHSGGPGGGGFLSEQANNAAGDTSPSPVTNNSGASTTGSDGAAYSTGSGGGENVGTSGVASVENRPPYYALTFIIKT